MKTMSELRAFQKKNQRFPTLSEQIMMGAFHRAGMQFRHQPIIGFYLPDFLIRDRLLLIEMDGDSHDGREEKDRLRDGFLLSCGFYIWRIRHNRSFSSIIADTYCADIKIMHPVVQDWEKKIASLIARANGYYSAANNKRLAQGGENE